MLCRGGDNRKKFGRKVRHWRFSFHCVTGLAAMWMRMRGERKCVLVSVGCEWANCRSISRTISRTIIAITLLPKGTKCCFAWVAVPLVVGLVAGCKSWHGSWALCSFILPAFTFHSSCFLRFLHADEGTHPPTHITPQQRVRISGSSSSSIDLAGQTHF